MTKIIGLNVNITLFLIFHLSLSPSRQADLRT